MFSLPDRAAYPTMFADYLELCALCSPVNYVSVNQVLAGFSFEEDVENMDWADEDVDRDDIVLSVQETLARRKKIIGEAYPFEVVDSGRRLEYKGPVNILNAMYLFSLLLSHSVDATVIPQESAPTLTNEVRNWFQSLSTVAAGGYVEGVAVSFGWPRPDRASFAAAIRTTYSRLGEGVVRAAPRPAAPKRIKDGGIDIIAWKPSIDGRAGKLYLIGQVASGENWKGKSVKEHANLFHKVWFTQPPASPHISSMFMPFSLEPDDPSDPNIGYEELLDDHAQMLTDEFGHVFYRDRLAAYALKGKGLIEAGNGQIEGYQDLPKIAAWVGEQVSNLREKVAA